MQKNYLCGALIKQVHDELEKKANALLRLQDLTLSQMNVLMELEAVPKAVLKNTIPAMAAMLMVLIYNLADTLFIGMTHDAYQVAAVSMATPCS